MNYAFNLECIDGGYGWGETGAQRKLVVSSRSRQDAEQQVRLQVPGGWRIKYAGTTNEAKGLSTGIGGGG